MINYKSIHLLKRTRKKCALGAIIERDGVWRFGDGDLSSLTEDKWAFASCAHPFALHICIYFIPDQWRVFFMHSDWLLKLGIVSDYSPKWK